MLQTVLASDSQWLLLLRLRDVEKQRRGDNLVAALLQRVRGTECAGDVLTQLQEPSNSRASHGGTQLA